MKQFHIVWQIGHDGNGPLLTGRTFPADSMLEALADFNRFRQVEACKELCAEQLRRVPEGHIFTNAQLLEPSKEFAELEKRLLKEDPLYIYNLDLGILPTYKH